MCVFAIVGLPITISFVCCQIHFGKFFVFIFAQWLLFQWRKVNFGIRNVAFEAKVLNRYSTFDQIANRCMEDLGFTYLHCDFLDMLVLTMSTLRVELLHIEMHEQHLYKNMFVEVNFLALSQSLKGVLKKVTCMLSLQLSRQPLCH